jgi:hypothetical protein
MIEVGSVVIVIGRFEILCARVPMEAIGWNALDL